MRILLPGSLTFLHASGFSGEDGEGGVETRVWCRLGAVLSEKRLGGCGATGKVPFSACDCPYSTFGGGRSQKRRTSSGLGMTTVPSLVREQPLPESSDTPTKKGKIRPNISNTPRRLYSGYELADNRAE